MEVPRVPPAALQRVQYPQSPEGAPACSGADSTARTPQYGTGEGGRGVLTL